MGRNAPNLNKRYYYSRFLWVRLQVCWNRETHRPPLSRRPAPPPAIGTPAIGASAPRAWRLAPGAHQDAQPSHPADSARGPKAPRPGRPVESVRFMQRKVESVGFMRSEVDTVRFVREKVGTVQLVQDRRLRNARSARYPRFLAQMTRYPAPGGASGPSGGAHTAGKRALLASEGVHKHAPVAASAHEEISRRGSPSTCAGHETPQLPGTIMPCTPGSNHLPSAPCRTACNSYRQRLHNVQFMQLNAAQRTICTAKSCIARNSYSEMQHSGQFVHRNLAQRAIQTGIAYELHAVQHFLVRNARCAAREGT